MHRQYVCNKYNKNGLTKKLTDIQSINSVFIIRISRQNLNFLKISIIPVSVLISLQTSTSLPIGRGLQCMVFSNAEPEHSGKEVESAVSNAAKVLSKMESGKCPLNVATTGSCKEQFHWSG